MTREQKKQANEILEKAKAKGVSSNFYFVTTFERYMTQLELMDRLKKSIDLDGPTVTKEYVKGRENLCVNPAVTEYNRTATAANGTVSTLIKIIDKFESIDNESRASSRLEELKNALSESSSVDNK